MGLSDSSVARKVLGVWGEIEGAVSGECKEFGFGVVGVKVVLEIWQWLCGWPLLWQK